MRSWHSYILHKHQLCSYCYFLDECALNFLVGANSPNLWPTMDSVINTGRCCFPFCTSNVIPTISGTIVERLAQVLIGLFWLLSFILITFSISFSSMYIPFFSDLVIFYFLLGLLALTTNLLVFFLLLVFLPRVCQPQGDLGAGIPIPLSLYEP